MLRIILLVFFVLLLIGSLPTWPHSYHWGYRPVTGVGIVFVILIVLYFMKVI
jgi:hypothetical protein